MHFQDNKTSLKTVAYLFFMKNTKMATFESSVVLLSIISKYSTNPSVQQ